MYFFFYAGKLSVFCPVDSGLHSYYNQLEWQKLYIFLTIHPLFIANYFKYFSSSLNYFSITLSTLFQPVL